VVTLDRLVNVLGYGVRLRFCAVPRSTELRSVVMHEDAHGRVVVGAPGHRCSFGGRHGAVGGGRARSPC
jgi:hypothetical protein